MSVRKCVFCDKVFIDVDQKECPYCKKDFREAQPPQDFDLQALKDLFGKESVK